MKDHPYFVAVQANFPVAKTERKMYSDPLFGEEVHLYNTEKFQKLTFAEAEPVFLAYKRTRVKQTTCTCYEMYCRYLRAHFGPKRLYEISIEDIRLYQQLRLEGKIQPPPSPVQKKSNRGKVPTHRAGASLINHEVNALSQMLEKAGVWERIVEWYSPVEQQEPDPPKTLTQEDEDSFFKIAATNPDWELAYWVASLSTVDA